MSRYIKEIQLGQPIDVVSVVMEDFVYHNHFSRADWNGEMVYFLKDRHHRERYMKWSYAGGIFHVEAWLKNAFGGEMDLDGVSGGASRKEFRQSMDELIVTLQKQSANSLAGGHVGSDPIHHDSHHYQENHEQWKKDTRWQKENTSQNKNTAATQYKVPELLRSKAMIYAILGILFGFSVPILGIVFGVMALKNSESRSLPKTMRILVTLVLVESVAVILMVALVGIGKFF